MTMNCDTVRDLAPAYVLGALTPDEEQAVRDHLATCDEPHPEFEVFGGVIQYFDETVELIEPPASLKDRVLAAAAAEPHLRGSGTPAGPVAAPPQAVAAPSNGAAGMPVAAPPFTAPPPESRAPHFPPVGASEAARPVDIGDVRARRRASPGTWLLRIAAVLAIVGLAGWNVLLQMQLGPAMAYDRAVTAVLDVATKPGSQTAILRGDGGQAPRGIAAVGSDGSVVIAMRDLQPTVGSEVYEAWALAPDGGPVPIGGFQVGSDGNGSLTTTLRSATGIALALTREPRPGATNPTTAIVAQGVASAPP